MFRAMVVKELRETGAILVLAFVAYVYITAPFMGIHYLPWTEWRNPVGVPFVDTINDPFAQNFGRVSAILAVALGLWQTLGEAIYGTYPFLLHRPANRRWLLGAKLLVGGGAYLICAALPVLGYALWAATTGTHAGPFQWSMTVDAWQIWARLVLLYLAAFLCGIRPGRWLGTRLLPMVRAGAVLYVLRTTNLSDLLGNIMILLADAVVLASILLAARQRDF